MNFKSLALASTLVLGSIFGSVSPAEARPTSCWANDPARGQVEELDHFNCDVTRYVSDGNWGWNGPYFHVAGIGRIFLSENNKAKVIFEGGGTGYFTWHYDSDGDIRLNGENGYQFSFRK